MMHPLDCLSKEEITAAAAACKARAKQDGLPTLRFNVITLKEPSKAALVAYEADNTHPVPRQALCIVQAFPAVPVIEVVVGLSNGKAAIKSWKQVEGGQPLASPDDCELAEKIAKADLGVQQLLRERGCTDLDLVACDPWSVHLPPVEGRLIQTFMYVRSSEFDNHYAHPLDFTPVVDLNLGKVVHVDKPYKEAPKIPAQDVNYHSSFMKQAWRTSAKPLNITQPEGPSFSVSGNAIDWERWHLRISFNFREGLVLHNVGYEDGGRVRPVLHRASLVEMCVPYGDPNPPFPRKCAFDVGDYGLGFCANSLALGCDCLGDITYFDALLSNSAGEPFELAKAVCLHEEDAGIAWKHMEYRTGNAEVRRLRRLVLSFVATVVNYEYAFYWYLYQDGSIEYQIKLTGELSTNLLSPGEGPDPVYGTLVAPGVNAQHHQHMFAARLDFAIDDPHGGAALAVSEVNVDAMPEGPANPYGNGFVASETDFETEAQAQRGVDASRARIWKIKNPNSLHPVTGKPVAYKLVPGTAPPLLARPSSMIYKRGQFASKNLWVTPHREEERYASGNFTIMSRGGDGLPSWTAQNRAIGSGHDPVVWYCFGITHVVRPEDFPVMPVETVGFHLKPFGFFNGNPGVDLPVMQSASKACCKALANGHANGHAIGHANGHA